MILLPPRRLAVEPTVVVAREQKGPWPSFDLPINLQINEQIRSRDWLVGIRPLPDDYCSDNVASTIASHSWRLIVSSVTSLTAKLGRRDLKVHVFAAGLHRTDTVKATG
jgi:hypothetical protein